jgi:hypothetical protein
VVRPYEFAEPIHGEPVKPRVRVKATSRAHLQGPAMRVMAIGDPHTKPGRDRRRFTWMGRHAAKTRPDHIVCIGDWGSFDSLSTHEQPGSQGDADRPGFWEELDDLDATAALFHKEAPPNIPKTLTLGNHEFRCERAANRQPKQSGDMPFRRDEVFARYGWDVHPFGEFVDVAGCDWVHVPLSIMGKEMGGEMVLRNVGLKALRTTIFGHVHRYGSLPIVKVGQQRAIRIVSLSTSMPYGMVEKYSGMSVTGWDWGCHDFWIQDGVILSERFVGMHELERDYS